MRSRLSACLLACMLALACTVAPLPTLPTTQAAHQPDTGQQQGLAAAKHFAVLYPELRQAPAPPWLRPGMRLSYNFAYATFARTPDDPTPSGGGILQYDVVAQDRRSVAVVPTMYSSQAQGQPPTTLGYQVELPGVGEVWFSPQVLADAESAAHDRFLVNRLTVEVEGKEYAVVRLQSINDGGEEVWEFDEQSGILVFYRQALFDDAGDITSSNILTLLGSRQVRLPWRFGSVPQWVARGVEIDLAGSQLMDLGGPPYIPLPLAINLQINKANTLWSEYTQTIWSSGRQVGQSVGATGVAQIFGGMWLPPEALGVLKAGAVLDRDRLTGVIIRVDEISAGATNRASIAISAASPGVLTRYTYEAATGRLIAYYQEANMGVGIQYTELAAQ